MKHSEETPGARRVPRQVTRWLSDERGHDLIEYMLLASVIAIAGWLAIQTLGANMNTSYRSWDEATQEIWEVPDPVSTP